MALSNIALRSFHKLTQAPKFYRSLKSISACFSTELQPVEDSTAPSDAGVKRKVRMNPLKHPDYFHVHNMFTVKDLFDARVHYGHKEGSFNDKMKPFIFGSRLGHLIFDLDITAFHLRQALNFAAHVALEDGIILFICQKPEFTLLVERTAQECKEFAFAREWKEYGIFTDSTAVFGEMIRLPDLCIILSTLNTVLSQHLAVVECAKLLIPTIGIVDSNCDPNLITYPVPGNDDSRASMELYCKLFKEAILRGKNERNRILKEEEEELKLLESSGKSQ